MASRSTKAAASAAGLVAAGAVAGAVLAGTLSASAANGSASGPTATPTHGSPGFAAPGAPGGHGGPGGAQLVRPGETELTGSDAAKAKAAALAAVPGGTVYRVETDADGSAYEAHMTKADGSLVTVKMNKTFTVVAVQDGMGVRKGAPPAGAPGAGSGTANGTGYGQNA